ncbi:MAG TPA: tRNA lysidine(34) synthetase TilS [Lysobacter sp.]
MPSAPPPTLPAALHDRPDAPVCVGYSGGLDSSVLLHLLASSAGAMPLRALHVNHGLHPQADAWAEHCTRTCATLGVPLTVVRVTVTRDGDGPEAAARSARHGAFAGALVAGDVLALAHHRDDQAETLLLRALRGSGIDGLAAMRRWRPFGPGRLWRPLLDHGRADVLAYAQAHGLAWIDDPSNSDTGFDRNFLRQRIVPMLQERWPHASAALAQSATLSAQASELLEEGDAQALAAAATADPHCLSRRRLLALPPTRRARVLRRWIATLGLPALPANGVARIEAEVLVAGDDADALFAWHGAAVRSWRDLLHADAVRPPLPGHWRSPWNGQAPLALPHGGHLRLEGATAFDDTLIAHARHGGERFVQPGRSHSHALKHVLQDLGVPPWVRDRLPLLGDGNGQVLAIADLAYSGPFDAWLRARGARLAWDDA